MLKIDLWDFDLPALLNLGDELVRLDLTAKHMELY